MSKFGLLLLIVDHIQVPGRLTKYQPVFLPDVPISLWEVKMKRN
jgi:hypothetical protein